MSEREAMVIVPAEEWDDMRRQVAEIRRLLSDRREPAVYLSTDEAAELLGVCGRTVRDLAKRGELPATWVARKWRFLRSDVEAYLAGG